MEPLIGGAPVDGLIKDSDTAQFAQDVIETSKQTPVIVDFWAPWCEPCKTLGPMLEAAVRMAGGSVKMVKINIDENQQLAQQLRVQSIPTVYGFFQGQPVDAFQGAVPESQIKEFVKKLSAHGSGSPLDAALEAAEEAMAEGDYEQASNIFSQVMQADGENGQAIAGLALCLLQNGEMAAAVELLEGLTDKLKSDSHVSAALAALELAQQAEDAGELGPLFAAVEADPEDHGARLELAKSLAAAGQRQEAVDQLIESIRRDRQWNEGAARAQLLTLFEAWGPGDDLTRSARRQLSSLLFS